MHLSRAALFDSFSLSFDSLRNLLLHSAIVNVNAAYETIVMNMRRENLTASKRELICSKRTRIRRRR